VIQLSGKKLIYSALFILAFLGFGFFASVKEAKADIVNTATTTSAVKDFGTGSASITVSWTASTSAGVTAVTMQVRAGTTATPASDTDENWTAWTSTNSGDTLGSTLIDKQYFQYRATLTSTDINQVAALYDVTIDRNVVPTPSLLISSPYDSGSQANILPKVSWTGTSTANSVIKFQIRAASTTEDLANATWCGFTDTGDTCTGTNYFEENKNGVQITDTDHPLMHGGNKRYFQYQVTFTSDGMTAPTLYDVTVTYVVNAAPQFEAAPTVEQRTSDGKVLINYSALDPDTAASEVACPNCVVASFRYSLNAGGSWTTIPAQYLSTPQGANLGFGTSTVATATTTYGVLWDAKSQINGISTSTAQIEITLNDLEGGNNTGATTTASFTLDVQNPVLGIAGATATTTNGIMVDATTNPASLTLAATDDTAGLKMCITLTNPGANILDDAECVAYASTSTIALLTDPDVVYVQFKDTHNNVINASATTPETPTGTVIRDISDVVSDPAVYREFLAWKSVALPFYKYHIYYKVDGVSDWQELSSITDRALNYYFHQDMTGSVTYRYKVTTEDDFGNTSYYSVEVNDLTDGVGGTNSTPPNISNITMTATTTQGITITWDTDVLANSSVYYSTVQPGFGTSFDQTVGTVTMLDNPIGLGQHSIAITNLAADTTYWFQIQSVNALGIAATDSNGGEGYSFHTLAGPVISGVTATQIFNSSATVVWNTDQSADSYVSYATSTTNFDTIKTQSGTGDSVTGHTITLTNLSAGTTYYYSIQSGIATDNNGNAYYTFTTSYDSVAPVITNATSTLVTDSQALITWTTNELANSEVLYGTATGNYTLSASDSNSALNHNVVLSSLATSTIYYYKVRSTDPSGNIATSTDEYTFTTLETLSQESAVLLRELQANATGQATGAANVVCGGGGGGGSSIDRTKPVVSAVVVSGITGESATVSWKTDKTANGLVQYGLSIQYDYGQINTDLSSDHAVTLSHLTPDTVYHYRISSIDGNGNLGASSDATFTTADSLGLSKETKPEMSAADKDSMFAAALEKVAGYLSTMSNQISVNILETSLNDQHSLLERLSGNLPAPLLSGEPRVITTATTANVTWRTDKDSNSLVALAAEDKYDKSKGNDGYAQVVGDADTMTQIHVVTISDLEPEMVYHYQVRSKSALGGVGQSGDFVFKTKSKELEISDYTVEKVNAQTAIFRWLTTAETDASVKYTPFRNGVLEVDSAKTEKNKNFSTMHEVSVEEFESGIVYEVELSGKDIKGQIISKKISSFSTGDDNFPPTIYQVQTESALSAGKESNVQTIISWMTDEPATAQVFYQKGVGAVTDDAWEKTQMDTNYSKKHIAVITKFEAGQIYQFRLQSSDSNGNLGVSKIYTILAPKQKESVFQVIMKNFEDIFGWTKQLNN
jgi:hypothetical protein